MTNQYSKIVIVLLTIFSISFITSCVPEPCPIPVMFYLRDVDVKAMDKVEEADGTIKLVQTDTIRHQVVFEVYPTVEIAAVETKKRGGLMNVAYGDCNTGIPLNAIKPEKSKMYTDTDFYYDGGFIPAGENFLEHEGFKEFVNFPTFLNYDGTSLITMEGVPLKFFNDAYIFSFEWQTNDGTLLTDDVEVYFR
ncbi:MAG: hypothetical protein AB8G11_09030 [Saprospiraceae bacterium]